jgi:hypothetical protein
VLDAGVVAVAQGVEQLGEEHLVVGVGGGGERPERGSLGGEEILVGGAAGDLEDGRGGVPVLVEVDQDQARDVALGEAVAVGSAAAAGATVWVVEAVALVATVAFVAFAVPAVSAGRAA